MKSADPLRRIIINWYVGFLTLLIPRGVSSVIIDDGQRLILDNSDVTHCRSRCVVSFR
jgi:hypothetical protein